MQPDLRAANREARMTVAKFGIGQPVRRVEDQRLLTGQGRYLDDAAPEGCLHALALRSPHAQAGFAVTDLAAARAIPGVRLVLTAPDVAHLGDVPCQAPVPNDGGSQGHLAHIPVLARDTVRHVGDAIAFVVADDVAAARDGVEAIGVDYEVLPAIVDLRGATGTARRRSGAKLRTTSPSMPASATKPPSRRPSPRRRAAPRSRSRTTG